MNSPLRSVFKTCLLCLLIFVCVFPAQAKVTRIVIAQKQSPAYQGKPFGPVEHYEILTGKAYGELDLGDGMETISVRIAKNLDGSSITGLALAC